MTKEECKRKILKSTPLKLMKLSAESLQMLTMDFDEELVRLILIQVDKIPEEIPFDALPLVEGTQLDMLIKTEVAYKQCNGKYDDYSGTYYAELPEYFRELHMLIELGEEIIAKVEIPVLNAKEMTSDELLSISADIKYLLGENTTELQNALVSALDDIKTLRDGTISALENKLKEQIERANDLENLAATYRTKYEALEKEQNATKKSCKKEETIIANIVEAARNFWCSKEDTKELNVVAKLLNLLNYNEASQNLYGFIEKMTAQPTNVTVNGPMNDIHDCQAVKAGL